MNLKVYAYKNCSTCQKALRFLEGQPYELLPIVEQPPSLDELQRMVAYLDGDFRKLFNTSGQLYREMKVAEQLKGGMTQQQALELLCRHGKLVKRPFLLSDAGGTVGFNEARWRELLEGRPAPP